MKLLQAARLSRLADASTGLDKQDEQVRRYAQAYDHEIVGTAADADVSGSVPPWERPELGSWLNDPARLAQIDGIIASALDRLGRNARDLSKLRDWAEDQGKTLIVISPNIKWPPSPDDLASPIVWDVLGRLAEYELATITKRARETQTWLKANDFLVGKPIYGYRVVKVSGSEHKTLEPDPITSRIVREAVDRYLSGDTLDTIVADFTRRGVPSPNPPTRKHPDPKWSARTLGAILRNVSLCGRRQQGTRTLKYQPIITLAEHRRIVAQLNERAHRRGVAAGNTAMLTSILFCPKCGGPMTRIKTRDGLFYYCRARKGCKMLVSMVATDAMAQWKVFRYLGDALITRTEVIAGKDWEDEIDQIKLDLAQLDPESADYLDQIAEGHAQIAELRSRKVEEPREVKVPTGERLGDYFADADALTRRRLLMAAGIKLIARKTDDEIGVDVEMALSASSNVVATVPNA
jgi:site-specific DNA recombinase